MLKQKISQLQSLKSKAAKLEAQLTRELAALPARHGFKTAKEFTDAVLRAGPSKGTAIVHRNRRTRAVITDKTREAVKNLVKIGRTGGQIAKACGISLPSVQNIKKQLGLVKARA